MDDSQVLKAFQEGIDSILNVVHSLSDNIESLNSEIGSLNSKMSLLKEENQTVHMKIAALESRLNKNSKNSSKPLSSNGYKKPPVNKANNSRVSSGRSTGGQDNQTGHTIAFSKSSNKDREDCLPYRHMHLWLLSGRGGSYGSEKTGV